MVCIPCQAKPKAAYWTGRNEFPEILNASIRSQTWIAVPNCRCASVWVHPLPEDVPNWESNMFVACLEFWPETSVARTADTVCQQDLLKESLELSSREENIQIDSCDVQKRLLSLMRTVSLFECILTSPMFETFHITKSWHRQDISTRNGPIEIGTTGHGRPSHSNSSTYPS